jgi:hypothetical protein
MTAIGRRVRNTVNPITTALTRAWCHSGLRRHILHLDRRSQVAFPAPSSDLGINRHLAPRGAARPSREDILS